jgi:AcrR family transcriptional regulator
MTIFIFHPPVIILLNMFTKIQAKPRGRGRPPGRTPQGDDSREHLYGTAVRLIAEKGYEATTLRDIAASAGVSPGLLYRYFPSKRAVVLELYDVLSREYVERMVHVPGGKWRERFLFALETSLDVLGPHRRTLAALVPLLVGDPHEGVLSEKMEFSRLRVQKGFRDALSGAEDAPRQEIADALARLLYLVHLLVLLFWLMDRSPNQRATNALIVMMRRAAPSVAIALRLPRARRWLRSADALVRDALLSSHSSS